MINRLRRSTTAVSVAISWSNACNSFPSIPEIVIPDPEPDAPLIAVITCWQSRHHIVYLRNEYTIPQMDYLVTECMWLWFKKSSSQSASQVIIDLENFCRGQKVNVNKGMVLYQACLPGQFEFHQNQRLFRLKECNSIQQDMNVPSLGQTSTDPGINDLIYGTII